jgi:hypothetical protein
MGLDESSGKHGRAVEEFNQHERRGDGVRVAGSLASGLGVLRDALFARMHEDVEQALGRDSMLVPVSEIKAQKLTKAEIEIFQIAESAAAVKEFGYASSVDWYVQWLVRLRFSASPADPNASKRVAQCLAEPPDKRRSRFESELAKVLPESTQAPLVLFRLFPLCVKIATALAFADHNRASGLRHSQAGLLPAIGDCRSCHGKVLENGEICQGCGNPLWKYSWLTTAD